MPTTGGLCTLESIYRSACSCASLAMLQPGLYFPSCFGCGQPVEWMPTTEEEAYGAPRDHLFARSGGQQEGRE